MQRLCLWVARSISAFVRPNARQLDGHVKERELGADVDEMLILTLGLLCLMLFTCGVLFMRLVTRDTSDSDHALLAGWLSCERALWTEGADAALLRRVRTRVPPTLRLRYEEFCVLQDVESLAESADRPN